MLKNRAKKERKSHFQEVESTLMQVVQGQLQNPRTATVRGTQNSATSDLDWAWAHRELKWAHTTTAKRPKQYAPHSHGRSRRELTFPHPHVGQPRSEHVARMASRSLAWGVEVGAVAARMGLGDKVPTARERGAAAAAVK